MIDATDSKQEPPAARLERHFAKSGVPSLSGLDQIADEFGVTSRFVLRQALRSAARNPDSEAIDAGVRLLRTALEQDLDTGASATGELLRRLAKGSETELVMDLLDEALAVDIGVPLDMLGGIASCFADKGRPDLVERCFAYAGRAGLELNPFLWAAKLRSQRLAGDANGALETYARTPEPTEKYHWSELMSVLVRSGRVEEAREALAQRESVYGPVRHAAPLAQLAEAIADEDPQAAVGFILDRNAHGVVFSPHRLTPVFRSFIRQHDPYSALDLIEGMTGQGVSPSTRNVSDLVEAFEGMNSPETLANLLPRLTPLLRGPQWSRLLDLTMPRGDKSPSWIQIIKDADRAAYEGGHADVVESLGPTTFTRLMSIAAADADAVAAKWLLSGRRRPTAGAFKIALEIADATNDAELGRSLVALMFETGISPRMQDFQAVADSYGGSLERVGEVFRAQVTSRQGGSLTPTNLSQLLVASVLQVYAETNQSDQSADVLRKFHGWPPLRDWEPLIPAVQTVAINRPALTIGYLNMLQESAPSLGEIPESLYATVMVTCAREGEVGVVQRLLDHRNPPAEGSRTRLTKRRAGILATSDAYRRLRCGRSFFKNPPTSGAPGDVWIPDMRTELTLLEALINGDKTHLARLRRSLSSSLPLDVHLKYWSAVHPTQAEYTKAYESLRHTFSSQGDQLRIDEALDRADLASGREQAVIARLQEPGARVTASRAEAYFRHHFDSELDRTQAMARFRAYTRGTEAKVQSLMRAVAEIDAAHGDPEAVRELLRDFSKFVSGTANIWEQLQRSYGADTASAALVVDEMLDAGTEPQLRNLRLVVYGHAANGDYEAAFKLIERFGGTIGDHTTGVLLGDLSMLAASRNNLPLAEQLRDQILSLGQSVPIGAEREIHKARVRQGLEEELVGNDAQPTLIKLDTFVRDVAHDMRNLLNPVWNRVANALEALTDQDEFDHEAAIQQLRGIEEVHHPNITRQITHWMAVADDDDAANDTADVGTTAARLLTLLQGDFAGSEIEAQCNVRRDLVRVALSPYQLDLVLRQLITNSIKHLRTVPADERSLNIAATHYERDGDREQMVLITVTDSGPGIPAHQRDAIYVSGFSTKPEQGVGRGLAMVFSVVSSAGGTISVESRTEDECKPGQRPMTRFSISVPSAQDSLNEE